MSCPDETRIQGFVEGTLSSVVRETVAVHVDGCEQCQTLLAGLSLVAANDAAARAQVAPGRYVLQSTLGAGGMGVVYEAHDRDLDRKVALKLLSAEPGEGEDRARARLQREAQALAKLAHPNVITVYDVGVLDGDLFVAMELVVGDTLRAWLARQPRSLGDILGVFRQAGDGLAAAHAAGFVHRDFKPENLLVGDDGRVRVTDFGLARPLVRDRAGAEPGAPDSDHGTLARAGARAGTPAYMSPEQAEGGTLSYASDWYGFGVTLYEALARRLPFGSQLVRRPAGDAQEEPRPPSELAPVSPGARRALRRSCSSASQRSARRGPRFCGAWRSPPKPGRPRPTGSAGRTRRTWRASRPPSPPRRAGARSSSTFAASRAWARARSCRGS